MDTSGGNTIIQFILLVIALSVVLILGLTRTIPWWATALAFAAALAFLAFVWD